MLEVSQVGVLYDVRIDHFRLSSDDARLLSASDRTDTALLLTRAMSITGLREAGTEISPTGGYTVAQLYQGDVMVAEAAAVCSPRDNFNKRIGRDIAVGRALKRLSAA